MSRSKHDMHCLGAWAKENGIKKYSYAFPGEAEKRRQEGVKAWHRQNREKMMNKDRNAKR